MAELVWDQATCSRSGKPVKNCNCKGHTRNQNDEEDDDDEDEETDNAGTHSSKALNASLALKHFGGIAHAGAALQHASDGDNEEAAKAHIRAAAAHEREATKLRKDGKADEATQHLDTAFTHRKAASMHRSTTTDNA